MQLIASFTVCRFLKIANFLYRYANWLGVDYEKSGRTVRKAINDGISDLIENKYLIQEGKNHYEFYEGGTAEKKEQKIPKNYCSSNYKRLRAISKRKFLLNY